MIIEKYTSKYRDDLIFMVLESKNALNRVPRINEDLLNIEESYFDSGGMFWIALDDNDRVIGSAGCNTFSDKTAVVHRLYVKYYLKRRGVGSALLEKAEAFAKRKGVDTIKVHLGDEKTYFESRYFYKKHGYIFDDEDNMSKRL